MKKTICTAILLLGLTACSVFGVHYSIHNPKRAGKYPKLTETRVLLGNQDSKFRTCFDVKWYGISIDAGTDLEKEKKISGSVDMLSVAVVDFDTLQLDLSENMQLGSVFNQHFISKNKSYGDAELKTFRKAGAVFIIMDKTIRKGESFGISMNYSGEPNEAKRPPWRGGFVRSHDDLKNPWWGVACETEGASSWWPCKDVVNDEPDSVDISFKVPVGFSVVSNGQLVSNQIMQSGKRSFSLWSWHISYPINIYNITFYIGKYKLLHDTYYSTVTHDTLQLNHYVLEQHYDKAKEHFKQAKEYIGFYEEKFGAYAFYNDGFKLVESPYAGMEHQSAIAYGNGFVNSPVYNYDYIILHETAHEWWGNAVTANDLADGWLHEGFATYSEALFLEKKYGKEAYLDHLSNNRDYIINRRPVVAPYGMRYFNFRDGDIYMKGEWILHSLRYSMHNDSIFFDVLKTFYNRFKYGNASSADLEKLVNEKTGQDYKWFFDQYLRNRFAPELEYCISNNQLFYRWKNVKEIYPYDFEMNVRVKLSGDRNGEIRIKPSCHTVQSSTGMGTNTIASFDEMDFLFGAVENKKLADIYRKSLQMKKGSGKNRTRSY